jgi:DNA-binding helix-hairpin-helix protein with protein kinase domain
MINQTFTGYNTTYIICKLLGKGGEGCVYELSNYPSLVLKLYNEPVSETKIRKLRLMASIKNVQLENYTAWVNDIVTDHQGTVRGFVMKKLVNYVPLHMLFGPMDRKKLFPEKGYNFLVHVARNLATAFYTCHEAGLIIGDVNEGNILVNSQGMVAFIDCDSFQIKDNFIYHYCEVGVPRYTPPELLEKLSFNNIIRTINSDSFSMAILIFQLLFLGRHPFAGKNNSTDNVDEETAIKKQWFAFSIYNKTNKLLPPLDSYDIKYLPISLIDLFHKSFEKTENRPVPINYIKELTIYLNDLIVCKKSKIHSYPSKLLQCPWCFFQETRNILFFLDDNYVKFLPNLTDIGRFINEFKIEKIIFSKLEFPVVPVKPVTGTGIDDKFNRFIWYHRLTLALVILTGLLLTYISGWYPVLGIVAAAILNNSLPWKKEIKKELKRRHEEFELYKGQLQRALNNYNFPPELISYDSLSNQIQREISQFKNLPDLLQVKRKSMEEKIYSEQLNKFLTSFDINKSSIPSFGITRKYSLAIAGIKNASDIDKLKYMKVYGIGPNYEQILFSWQRLIASKFNYHPDNNLINKEYRILVSEIEDLKRNLEKELLKNYQSLQYLKINFQSKQDQLKKYIDQTTIKYFISKINSEEFKKIFQVEVRD